MKLGKVFTHKQWKKFKRNLEASVEKQCAWHHNEGMLKGLKQGRKEANELLAAALYQEIATPANHAPVVHTKKELVGTVTYRIRDEWFCVGDDTTRQRVELYKKELLPYEIEID